MRMDVSMGRCEYVREGDVIVVMRLDEGVYVIDCECDYGFDCGCERESEFGLCVYEFV